MKRAAWFCAIILLTLLGYWFFPGHTYLQSDTQIYVPMMERLGDSSLYSRDIMAQRPHVAFTIYDETALGLKHALGVDFQVVLTIEQLIFRSLGILGLILIARSIGLDEIESFFVAAVISLGASIIGPAVLTVEYESVPRGFAVPLLLLALGLIAHERCVAAGIAAAIAFLYHPPTTLPFWVIATVLVLIGRARWTLIAPLVVAAAMLLATAALKPHGLESASLLRRIDPFQESLQRIRASYCFVSTWSSQIFADFAIQSVICVAAFWRVRKSLTPPLREFVWALPLFGLLCVPLSWILLEHEHWALIPEWQPARALLFVTLIGALLCAIAGIRAKNFAERSVWFTAAFLASVQHAMLGRTISGAPLALAATLALVSAASRWMLMPVALLAFVAIPEFSFVQNYPQVETSELRDVAAWAKALTPKDALFLFPDSGKGLEPGIFRARSLRGLYVDWKSGGQVNYFPEFSREWWKRWVETGSGKWNVTAADFSKLASMGIDYVVLNREHSIKEAAPAHENAAYVVYSTATSSRDYR